uniref:Hypothetical secreted peptide 2043 n=1 Tax=Amblyomma variegatum TaxID=34610 RepID=F0JA11_AMBVA|nr:TPA_inf: hypothetical secreted peptide precursor 2043 [Amblyomma variegatum]
MCFKVHRFSSTLLCMVQAKSVLDGIDFKCPLHCCTYRWNVISNGSVPHSSQTVHGSGNCDASRCLIAHLD